MNKTWLWVTSQVYYLKFFHLIKVINKENQLSEIGSLVKIDPTRINDNVSDELSEILSKNPVGQVIGYKITDGTDLGLIIKLNNGSSAWFFNNELNQIDSSLISSSFSNISIAKKNKAIIFKKGIKYVLNPNNFIKWLISSLQDVI